MNDTNDRALRAVLDQDTDPQVPAAERDAALRDVAAIRRGLTLLAAQAHATAPVVGVGVEAAAASSALPVGPPHPAPYRSAWVRRRRWALAAAGLAAAAVTAVLLAAPGHRAAAPFAAAPSPSASSPATLPVTAGGQAALAPPRSLSQRVAQAQRIVVGTVTQVTHGRLEREEPVPYVLSTIHVTETIKGPAGEAVALDWDYSGTKTTSEGDFRPWRVGDRVLLFLVSDTGTVFERVRPAHQQVAGGKDGRYLLAGESLVGADFTLADVRRLAG